MVETMDEAFAEVVALLYPMPHYGEPEGLTNCPRNGYRSPLTDEEMAAWSGYDKDAPCDCGADETNAKVRAIFDRIGWKSPAPPRAKRCR